MFDIIINRNVAIDLFHCEVNHSSYKRYKLLHIYHYYFLFITVLCSYNNHPNET